MARSDDALDPQPAASLAGAGGAGDDLSLSKDVWTVEVASAAGAGAGSQKENIVFVHLRTKKAGHYRDLGEVARQKLTPSCSPGGEKQCS